MVYQGNNVKDEHGGVALFQELSSAPATMQAGKSCDTWGLNHGHTIQQADAVQAYVQAKLKGDPTWVRLPREQWPASWQGMRDPVCPLILALYGHPDAGPKKVSRRLDSSPSLDGDPVFTTKSLDCF